MNWMPILAIALLTLVACTPGIRSDGNGRAELAHSASGERPSTEDGSIVFAGLPPGSAAVEGTRLFGMPTAGSGPVVQPAYPGISLGPVWSADDSRLAVGSQRGREFHFVVVDTGALLRNELPADGGRRWPVGTQSAWTRGEEEFRQGVLSNHDFPRTRRIATNELDDVFFWFSMSSEPPSTGAPWLAFGREPSGDLADSGAFPSGDIYLVRADGSTAWRFPDRAGVEIFGAWSPDSTRIGFTAVGEGTSEVFVMSDDGSDLRRLSDGTSEDTWLGWSPDGQYVAFRSSLTEGNVLRIVDRLGDPVQGLVIIDCEDSFGFAWAPDGRRFAFTDGCSLGPEFWLAAIDGGAPTPLIQKIGTRADWYTGQTG